jgi:hypothetical protein
MKVASLRNDPHAVQGVQPQALPKPSPGWPDAQLAVGPTAKMPRLLVGRNAETHSFRPSQETFSGPVAHPSHWIDFH